MTKDNLGKTIEVERRQAIEEERRKLHIQLESIPRLEEELVLKNVNLKIYCLEED